MYLIEPPKICIKLETEWLKCFLLEESSLFAITYVDKEETNFSVVIIW